MGLENVDRCQHLKMNGTQCGSPALRRRRLCFFHRRVQEQGARILSSQFGQARFVVPVLEDANAVQLALMQVMQLLATGQMDHKTAGLMLYALQTASCNLRNTTFEAVDVTDVVIDSNDVHRTAMGGPQWFEEDFDDEEEASDDEDEQETEEVGEEEEAEVCAEVAEKVKQVSTEEARKQVRGVVENWVLETVAAAVAQEPG